MVELSRTSRPEVEPFSESIGAEIKGVDPRVDAAAAARVVRDAVTRHRVAVLGLERPLSDPELLDFAGALGPILVEYPDGPTGRSVEVIAVVTDERSGRPALDSGWPAAGLPWHNDYSYLPRPAQDSILQPVELPASGDGTTSFIDMAAALDALDDDEREALRRSTVSCELVPSFATKFGTGPGTVTAPLIVHHPLLEREVLWLGPAFGLIDELDPETSEARRDALIEHATAHGRRYDHTWQLGDVVVFDNLAVMHERSEIRPEHRREMRQVSTQLPDPVGTVRPPTLS